MSLGSQPEKNNTRAIPYILQQDKFQMNQRFNCKSESMRVLEESWEKCFIILVQKRPFKHDTEAVNQKIDKLQPHTKILINLYSENYNKQWQKKNDKLG